MIKTRIITEKQRKFLEKTLCILGISLNELLLVNNLTEIMEENKILKEQNEILNSKCDLLEERLKNAEADISTLALKLQQSLFDAIWGEGEMSANKEKAENY